MDVPMVVRREYGSWAWSSAWDMVPERATWRLDAPDGRVRFLKVTPAGWAPRLADEAERMRWAAAHLPVPEVLDCGSDGTVDWLVTTALPGLNATADGLRADPAAMVRLAAEGLRRIHTVPVADCPFEFRVDTALDRVCEVVATGAAAHQLRVHAEHRHLTVDAALAALDRLRPHNEDHVVCHGDPCLPNYMIDNGALSGFVDLGAMAVADRWSDLAVASWSITWNLGPGWEGAFFDAYGVEPDPDRIAFYRLLYDMT